MIRAFPEAAACPDLFALLIDPIPGPLHNMPARRIMVSNSAGWRGSALLLCIAWDLVYEMAQAPGYRDLRHMASYPMLCRSFSMALFSRRDTCTWLTPRIFAHCCWVSPL